MSAMSPVGRDGCHAGSEIDTKNVYARADLDARVFPPVKDFREEDDALELDALDRDDPPTLDESSPDILYNTMGRHGDC